MQHPRSPTPAMASSKSNIFSPDFSTKSQSNRTLDQLTVNLRPKYASMPGELHLPYPPFAQQQNLPHSNIQHEAQLAVPIPCITCLYLRNHPFQPPFLLPQQRDNLQPSSSILASTATYLPVPNNAPQNSVFSPHTRLVRFPPHRNGPLTVTSVKTCGILLKITPRK